MDKSTSSTNKMSSPATLGDESSPWQSSGTSAGEDDLVHEESMLKRKLAVLEEFTDSGEIAIYLRFFSSEEMRLSSQTKLFTSSRSPLL
jgi:hypothetical protein